MPGRTEGIAQEVKTLYAFEKLSQGISETGPDKSAHAHIGLWGLGHIKGILTCVAEALAKRGLKPSSYVGIGAFYDDVQYPIEKLGAFLEAKKAGEEGPIDEKTASIFVDFLKVKLDKLKVMTREVDDDYNE